jgi:hypothetical protein
MWRLRYYWHVLAQRDTWNLYAWLRDHTLCRWGHHCAPHKRVQKFDGGKLPQLCCYCRLIVAWGPRPGKQ